MVEIGMINNVSASNRYFGWLDVVGKLADRLQSPFALGTRWYVAWVFLHSGQLKLQDWEQTVALFETEYKVPLLSPWLAAVVGTAGEVVFAILLILGLGGRIAPLGLFAVNVLAVVSYSHVLLTDDGLFGLRQHQFWGFMLAMLTIYGMGNWTLDNLIKRFVKP
jgi:putative oxidoreductase